MIIIEKIKEAGIPLRRLDDEIDNLMQYFIQIERHADGLTDLVKDAELLPNQVQSFLYVLE